MRKQVGAKARGIVRGLQTRLGAPGGTSQQAESSIPYDVNIYIYVCVYTCLGQKDSQGSPACDSFLSHCRPASARP